ncbi:MAG: hypothetical protein WC378_07210 [Opitutaceae bacterium]
MALAWCFNEPWPGAANLSLLSWPDRPKASLATVGQACRPVLASARLRKFQWSAGEAFDPELWILNDRQEALPAGVLELWIEAGESRIQLLRWDYPPAEAARNIQGPRAHLLLPEMAADHFELVLNAQNMPEMNSRYRLSYRKSGKIERERRMNI